MTIEINKIHWKIYKREPNDASFATTQYDTLEIFIDKDLAKDNRLPTIIHEVTHAYLFSTGRSLEDVFDREQIAELMGYHAQNIIDIATRIANNWKNIKAK